MAPYWLPQAVANGFDMDNMDVFEIQGGGEFGEDENQDPQPQTKERKKQNEPK